MLYLLIIYWKAALVPENKLTMHYLLFTLTVTVELLFTYPERWAIKYKRIKLQHQRSRVNKIAQRRISVTESQPVTHLQPIAA